MEKLNSVQRFYAGKTIFITGGSGFMGKVLIEKLLYSCSEIREIIVLMRPKRGKTGAQRVEDFSKLPLFKRIMDEKPDMMSKICPVYGEITKPLLALSPEHLRHVIENTHIVFHLAASLKLEATLKPNIESNLTATKFVLDLAREMKNLVQMVHTSTAFCNIKDDVVFEKVYDHEHDPDELIRTARWMSEDAMAKAQKTLLGCHANTYTYTKHLAENLVMRYYQSYALPVCIFRPSIVVPSYAEPFEGWVDSLNGPPGVVMAVGGGALRCLLIDLDAEMQSIPVDICINALLTSTKFVATVKERPCEIPVFHSTWNDVGRLTYRFFFDTANKYKSECPMSMSLWYPNCSTTTNQYVYWINSFLFQWIPAYFVDLLMAIFRQKRFLVKVQQKIAVGIDVLKFFTCKPWNFRTDEIMRVRSSLSKDEFEMFPMDTSIIADNDLFVKSNMYGGRVHCLKDPLTTLPRARLIYKIQYVVDRLCKFFFFYWLIRKVLNFMEIM